MKLHKHIEDSRASLINAIKHIDDLEDSQQNYAILTLNAALKEIDAAARIANQKKKDDAQKNLFETFHSLGDNKEYIGDIVNHVEGIGDTINDFKLMVLRLEPTVIKGTKISGYLKTHHMPTCVPDIIEETEKNFGGGKFQIRIVDPAGKYVKSKTFEISGLPKIPERKDG